MSKQQESSSSETNKIGGGEFESLNLDYIEEVYSSTNQSKLSRSRKDLDTPKFGEIEAFKAVLRFLEDEEPMDVRTSHILHYLDYDVKEIKNSPVGSDLDDVRRNLTSSLDLLTNFDFLDGSWSDEIYRNGSPREGIEKESNAWRKIRNDLSLYSPSDYIDD